MNKKTCRVLHFGTHEEDCGIGKYQEQFLASMKEQGLPVENEFFEYSPNKTKYMSQAAFAPVLQQFRRQLEGFDVLHIQHEFSFYLHDELYQLVTTAKGMGKPVIVTVHTAPEGHYQTPDKPSLHPRSMLHYRRQKQRYARLEHVHMRAILLVDQVWVHNLATKNDLVKHGVKESDIVQIAMPVPRVAKMPAAGLRKRMAASEGDVIVGAVGFISRNKGVDQSVRALKFLPANYKLAIIGGVHPSGSNNVFLDELCDRIVQLNLEDRVYITGYEPDDDRLNAMIQECDLCVYPYDQKYYGYVSSAALSNALANGKPTVAYPVGTFVEMNQDDTLAITKSSNYYELARSIREIDQRKYAAAATRYADKHAYDREAALLATRYADLTGRR